MRRTILTAGMGVAMLIAPAAANAATNQGESGKVWAYTNPTVICASGSAVPQPKVEVEGGTSFTLTSAQAIASVSIKSGSKAAIVVEDSFWSPNTVTIALTQDWSNYVVTTCEPQTGPPAD